MAVTTDIFESWVRPRIVVRRLLARGGGEPFALSLLLTFLVLALVALLPGMARVSYIEGGTPVAPRVLAAAMGLLATLPLWYLLAALGTAVARGLGTGGSFHRGRIALFWAALAATPAMLLQGLVLGMVGPGSAATAIGLLVALAFVIFWVLGLGEAGAHDAA